MRCRSLFANYLLLQGYNFTGGRTHVNYQIRNDIKTDLNITLVLPFVTCHVMGRNLKASMQEKKEKFK